MQSIVGRAVKTAPTPFSWPLCSHTCTQLRHFPEGAKGERWLCHSQIAQTFITLLPRNWFPSRAQGWLTHQSSSCMNYTSLRHLPTSSPLQDINNIHQEDSAGLWAPVGLKKLLPLMIRYWPTLITKLNWTLMTYFPTESGPWMVFSLSRQVYLYFPAFK